MSLRTPFRLASLLVLAPLGLLAATGTVHYRFYVPANSFAEYNRMEKDPETGKEVAIRTLNPDAQVVLDSAQPTPVLLDEGALGPVLEYKGEGSIKLVRMKKQKDGAVQKSKVLEIAPSKVWTAAGSVIFLLTSADQGKTFTASPIPMDGKSVPDGSISVLNLCPTDFFVKGAKDSWVAIPAGARQAVPHPEPQNKAVELTVGIANRRKPGKVSTRIRESLIYTDKVQTPLIILTPSTAPDMPNVISLGNDFGKK